MTAPLDAFRNVVAEHAARQEREWQGLLALIDGLRAGSPAVGPPAPPDAGRLPATTRTAGDGDAG